MKRTLVLCAVLALFAVTGLFAQQKYKVGDRGPGSGIVFYAEGGNYIECLGIFGPVDWDRAVTLTENISDGGYKNWRLPTGAELSIIYKTLKKNNLMDFKDAGYWSSENSKNIEGSKWYVNFKNGYGGSKLPSEFIYCCPVRSF